MALSKYIKLSNGLELNYHVVDIVEGNDEETKVVVQSFGDKKYYKEAMKKDTLLKEQNTLIEEFSDIYNSIEDKENMTKLQQNKLNKLQNKINKLADDLSSCKDFSNYVLVETILTIDKLEDFSLSEIEKELLKTTMFENASSVD